MSYAARNIVYRPSSRKTYALIDGEKVCGRLFAAKTGSHGVYPQYYFKDTGITGVPDGVTAGYAASNGSIFICANGRLYVKPASDTLFYSMVTNFTGKPFFSEYGGKVVISDGNKFSQYNGTSLVTATAETPLYGGTVHYDRLFGVDVSDSLCVRWSAAGSVDGWDEGIRNSGWLKLAPQKGDILQLVSYGEKLIALRENGISVIKAYGATENFRVNATDIYCETVTYGTAAVCAGKLFFAAQGGLYSYDGTDIAREAADGLEGAGEILSGAAYGNEYFASLTIDGEKAVACIHGESGDTSFYRFTHDCLFSGKNVYAAVGGALYELCSPAGTFGWESGYTDLGEKGKKLLHSVYIDCDGLCSLTVESRGVSRIFTGVKGKVNVKMAGEGFYFTIEALSAVRSVTAVFEI
ncbi:MAG: hypothetical protein LUI60_02940 [Clostridia bacterium]|nr:hypothetical protein [Clostridia bacterium]